MKDGVRNRKRAEARAELINEQIEKRTFDYLEWFPEGNKKPLLRPDESEQRDPKTVNEYFRVWIESKKPPFVRAGLERDYREHFKRYMLPWFESVDPAFLSAARQDRSSARAGTYDDLAKIQPHGLHDVQ